MDEPMTDERLAEIRAYLVEGDCDCPQAGELSLMVEELLDKVDQLRDESANPADGERIDPDWVVASLNPDDHPVLWTTLGCDRPTLVYEDSREPVVIGRCPHVVTSDGGTSWCRLAEDREGGLMLTGADREVNVVQRTVEGPAPRSGRKRRS